MALGRRSLGPPSLGRLPGNLAAAFVRRSFKASLPADPPPGRPISAMTWEMSDELAGAASSGSPTEARTTRLAFCRVSSFGFLIRFGIQLHQCHAHSSGVKLERADRISKLTNDRQSRQSIEEVRERGRSVV